MALDLAIMEADDSLAPCVISQAKAPWHILHVNEPWCARHAHGTPCKHAHCTKPIAHHPYMPILTAIDPHCRSQLCGFTADEAIGETFSILQGKGTDTECAAAFARRMKHERSAETTLTNYTKSGRPFRHCISARLVQDQRNGTSFYVTESHEDQCETPQFAPLEDMLCAIFIVFLLFVWLLSAAAGSSLDEHSLALFTGHATLSNELEFALFAGFVKGGTR